MSGGGGGGFGGCSSEGMSGELTRDIDLLMYENRALSDSMSALSDAGVGGLLVDSGVDNDFRFCPI